MRCGVRLVPQWLLHHTPLLSWSMFTLHTVCLYRPVHSLDSLIVVLFEYVLTAHVYIDRYTKYYTLILPVNYRATALPSIPSILSIYTSITSTL